MQIYCEFLQKNYESAASLADLHEKFYPYDENGDYANYMKSLSLFKLMRGYKRDIAAIEDAELAINVLKENYPSSKYNNILESKMLEIQKLKYLNELEIATFYFKTHKFLSALKQVILINNQYKSSYNRPADKSEMEYWIGQYTSYTYSTVSEIQSAISRLGEVRSSTGAIDECGAAV